LTHLTHIIGSWSDNIGNAFFQLGGYHVLKTVLPDATFSLINEKPGYPRYWNPRGGNPRGYFDMAAAIKSDYLVLMGPMFRPETIQIWGDTLDKLQGKETRLVLLGVGAMHYEPQYIEEYQNILKKYPPYLLISRDSETYEKLGHLAQYSYNGIDLAFFVPDYYPIYGFENIPHYVAFNFDKVPEPEIYIHAQGSQTQNHKQGSKSFFFNNETWIVKPNGWRIRLARKSRYLSFLEGVLFMGRQTKQIGQYQIIRTDHRYCPIIGRKTFRYPTMMVNDTPYPYFEIYGNAHLVLSDRLHACIIGLAYGKPAMLFSETPRLRLIERLNLADITKNPVQLEPSVLGMEKANIITFLKMHLT
jgi:hypothetical protein